MKKFILILFSAVALSAAVHAQDSTTAHHHEKGESAIKQQRMDMMQQLNLTDEQKAKMQKLREEQRAKMDSIHSSSLSDDEKKAQMKTLREDSRKEMDNILTPEQRSKLQEMRKEEMEKRKAQKQGADSTK
jgi:protein CpxP